MTTQDSPTTAPGVLLVGAQGFGASHLRHLEQLGDSIRLLGLVDPKGPPASGFGADAPCWADLADCFASGLAPDVVIIATPTGTHAPLARLALRHGADVYLEKPPTATMADFEDLLALQAATGRAVQVGFQSLGSHALPALARLGRPTSVATWAGWLRTRAYWTRSAWAGRRSLDGRPVVDGVLTNPLSHAIATALRIAGARRREDIARVELELLRANDIEADDTSSVRVTLADGRVVSAALTLCAPVQSEPVIEVRAPGGDALYWYKDDRIRVAGIEQSLGTGNLFDELLEHRTTGTPLSCALVDCGAYMEVLEAVRTAPDPVPVPASAVVWEGTGADAHPVLTDVEQWVERTARAGALFSEAGAPWSAAVAGRG